MNRLLDGWSRSGCIRIAVDIGHSHVATSGKTSCNNTNNRNANICIARLKQNSSGALMAQTNTVSVLSFEFCFSVLVLSHMVTFYVHHLDNRSRSVGKLFFYTAFV